MFTHIVIFWTDPSKPEAADVVLEGAKRLLPNIPGVLNFHAGLMVGSERPVVDQTYQVGLNLTFENKAAESAYQVHHDHIEFVETVFKPNCVKVAIYDFE